MKLMDSKDNIKQFIRFCIVGAINTLISFIVYSGLVYLGINYLISNILGYVTGLLNSFLLSKSFVFKIKRTSINTTLKFIMVYGFTLAMNTIFLFLLVNKFLLNKYIAQVFVIGLGTMINFIGNKLWTFNRSS